MTALTNAQRQAAYRARHRNGATAGSAQADTVTEQPMDRAVQMYWWARQLVAGKCNPYQRHVLRVRYGCDWVHGAVTGWTR